jgi:hypothetical protein
MRTVIEFYDNLSYGIMSFIVGPLSGVINFESRVVDSLKSTLESTSLVLAQGRLNDAYVLLREYYDAITINTFEVIVLLEDRDVELPSANQIASWVKGEKPLPTFREMNQRIRNYEPLRRISAILGKNALYSGIRKRCNDHCHFNYFAYMELNCDVMYSEHAKVLSSFERDLVALVVMHFAYLLSLRPFYMSGSDYIDALELGRTPEPDSQYWVAPYAQKFFTEFVSLHNPDVAVEIRTSTYMKLE